MLPEMSLVEDCKEQQNNAVKGVDRGDMVIDKAKRADSRLEEEPAWTTANGPIDYSSENQTTLSAQFQLGLKLQKAAEQGDLASIAFLRLSAGEIIDSEDSGEAIALPNELNALAIRFNCGHGVRKDTQEARRLWQIAAEAGSADAQFWSAHMQSDDATAADLYIQSARQGHSGSQFELGRLLAKGAPGLAQDREKARHYFALAAAEVIESEAAAEVPYKYLSLLREAAAKHLSQMCEDGCGMRRKRVTACRENCSSGYDLVYEKGRLVEASV